MWPKDNGGESKEEFPTAALYKINVRWGVTQLKKKKKGEKDRKVKQEEKRKNKGRKDGRMKRRACREVR